MGANYIKSSFFWFSSSRDKYVPIWDPPVVCTLLWVLSFHFADPQPHKSKSKCIYFCGKLTRLTKPDNLKLLGEDLPWVPSADHLGHVLHQSGTMDQDAAVKRARFIDRTVGLRESFYFAYPEQTMRAVQVFACDAYGSMLCLMSITVQELEHMHKVDMACSKKYLHILVGQCPVCWFCLPQSPGIWEVCLLLSEVVHEQQQRSQTSC